MYVYIYIYIYVYTCMYMYIYIEREMYNICIYYTYVHDLNVCVYIICLMYDVSRKV